jgi:hypothetical protein
MEIRVDQPDARDQATSAIAASTITKVSSTTRLIKWCPDIIKWLLRFAVLQWRWLQRAR